MISILHIPLSLLPVLVFLAILVLLDSFKLMPLRAVLRCIAVGMIVAVVCYLINGWLLESLPLSSESFRRYVAPLIEELLKALFVAYLIRKAQVGFLVDAAIAGFAVGAGFALLENVNYLVAIDDRNLFLWVVRGFGTAIMHGSTVAVFAIISRAVTERHGSASVVHFLPGFALAFAIHSFFNHFFLHPLLTTVILLVVMPLVVILVFERSEKSTRQWLGVGFDTDVELLDLVTSGQMTHSRVDQYLESLRQRFPGPVMGDILCLLRVHLELSIRAKGILLAREAGLRLAPDEFVMANLEELKFLNKSVGRTGRLALAPFLNMSSRDLWQLYMLSTEGERSRPRPG